VKLAVEIPAVPQRSACAESAGRRLGTAEYIDDDVGPSARSATRPQPGSSWCSRRRSARRQAGCVASSEPWSPRSRRSLAIPRRRRRPLPGSRLWTSARRSD